MRERDPDNQDQLLPDSISNEGAAQGSRAGDVSREAWSALVITSLVFFLSVVDMSAVNVGFPAMAADFGISETSLSWVVSGYNVTIGALLLTAGRLADSIGRRRVFMPGVAIFLVGSIAAALAPTVGWLIAARVVQGIGAAIIAPTALAVVLPDFPPARRSMAIGLAGAVGSFGAVAGPALGSLSIELWSWRGIFWINVPVCLLVLALAPRLLRESKNPEANGRIDLLGVGIGSTAVTLVMLAIVRSQSWGGDWLSLVLLAVGLALIPLLVRRSKRHPEPLVEPDLFRFPSFRSTNVGVSAWSLGYASGFLANSLFLQRFWDVPIATVGKALIVSPLVGAVVSPLSGRLADRVGHRWILAGGSGLCSVGYLLFYFGLGDEPQVWTRFVPVTVLVGLGIGTTVATWASAGLADVPVARLGTANATVRTTQQVFFAVGVALVITLLTSGGGIESLAVYRQSWLFIALMFGCAGVVIAATFPPGSSSDRLRRLAARVEDVTDSPSDSDSDSVDSDSVNGDSDDSDDSASDDGDDRLDVPAVDDDPVPVLVG